MVIQVIVLWIPSSFPSHFFVAVFKERFDTYATRSWKTSTEKAKRGGLGKTDPQKGQNQKWDE